jgi:hypothetical protein
MIDFNESVLVSYILHNEEIAASTSSRPIPRVGEFVEISGKVYIVKGVKHKVSQIDSNVTVILE